MPTPDGRIGSRDLCTGAVVERVVGDGAISSLKISATLESDNYSAGSAGWQINRATGAAEFQSATIRGTLNASDIVTGTLNADLITVTNLSADAITTGTLDGDQVTVTNINADYITTGTLSANYINGGTLNGGVVTITNINASNITTGTLSAAYIGSGTTGGITINLGTAGVIQSQTGGVIIRGNGTAEFTNVTITGTLVTNSVTGWLTTTGSGGFRTASSGTRIALGSAVGSAYLNFYHSSSSSNGYIVAYANGLTIASPASTNRSNIELVGQGGGGNAGIQLNGYSGFTYGTVATGGTTAILAQASQSAYLYGTGSGETVRIGTSNSANRALLAIYNSSSSYLFEVRHTGQTGHANGTVAAPSIAFLNDYNTGVYRVAENYIGLAAGGVILAQFGYTSPNKEIYLYGMPSNGANPYVRINTSTGQLQYDSSTRDIKANIADLDAPGFDRLRPVRFDMRDGSAFAQFGFIAEEVADIYPSLANWGYATVTGPDEVQTGERKIVNYETRGILALTVAKVQQLQARIEALEAA